MHFLNMALIDKASLLMVPSTYEAGKLYNVLPSGNRAPDSTGENSGYDQTRADFDFDRGSNAAATRIGSDGLLKKYRENLLTESNNFSDSDWNVKAGTFTQGVEDPDGGNNAWSWTAQNTDPYLYQSGKSVSGVSTLSIWVKGVGSTIGASFQIRTGAAPYKNLTLTGDWQRVEHFNTNTSATSVGFEYGNPAVVGDVVHIYQAQYEAGTIATDVLTSGATTGKAGVLIDLPRIDYSSGAGALLLEPQRANLMQYSEYFGGWSKATGGTGSNPVLDFGYTSPEGEDNAYKVTFDKGAGTTPSDLSVLQTSFTSGSNTASFYVKADAPTRLMVRNSGTWAIYDIGTEWMRIEKTDTGGSVQIGLREGYGLSDVPDSCSVYLWGAQVEASASYATSYIPNHGTSGGVTRAADDASVSDLQNLNVFNGSQGAVLFEGVKNGETIFSNFVVTANSNTNKSLLVDNSSGTIRLRVWNASSGQDATITTSSVDDGTFKYLIKWNAGSLAVYFNGSSVGTDTITAYSYTNVNLKEGTFSNNYIKQFTLFDEVPTDAECITLTTL